ncbi:hypothetical protein [Leifsonia sp. EB34]|uniref:hypothetical protein n=1 Tax=Leifsonia sp. EB34 TaxID=3156303 RepID=UPI0035173F0E
MRSIHADDVRASNPWWLVSNTRGYALFMGIFYPLAGGVFLVSWFVTGRWWNLLVGVSWLVLGAAAWASVAWHKRNRPRSGRDGRTDSGRSDD